MFSIIIIMVYCMCDGWWLLIVYCIPYFVFLIIYYVCHLRKYYVLITDLFNMYLLCIIYVFVYYGLIYFLFICLYLYIVYLFIMYCLFIYLFIYVLSALCGLFIDCQTMCLLMFKVIKDIHVINTIIIII